MIGGRNMKLLNGVECALFDIDGVLVNVRKSYYLAIKKSVEFIMKSMGGKKSHTLPLVTDTLILKFKQTGGFNNEIDIAYAIILALMSMPFIDWTSNKEDFLFTVAQNANDKGISSVEDYLSSLSTLSHIKKIKQHLVYPAPVGKSPLATVFDELFYGPTLFRMQHDIEPRYYHGKPLIDNDEIVIRKETVHLVSEKLQGNIALISGRSKLAAQYSLEPIFDMFDQNASVFLDDESRKHWKPNPYSIIKAMTSLGAKTSLYVGDSVEDLYMTRKAEKDMDVKILFIGVYGCSVQPQDTIRKFRENNVALIIESVNCLPDLMKIGTHHHPV
jgi:HAD superfamily phosphatase